MGIIDTYSDSAVYDWGRMDFDQTLLECMDFTDGSTIMEVGCGNGRFLKSLTAKCPTLMITGLDASQNGIDTCIRDLKGEFICADITRFEVIEKYDYVLCFQTLEHFRNPHIVIEKLKQLGKEIYISVPNANKDLCEDHFQFWTLDSFHEFLWFHFARVNTFLIDGDKNILAKCRI